MYKALPTILLLSLLISCSQKSDNADVTTSISPTSRNNASKEVENAKTEVNAEQSKSFVEKISMSVKQSFVTKDPVVTIDVDNIQFAFDSYQLSNDAREELNDLATALEENRKTSIVIAGHCDARGTKDYNLILGEKRAIAVKNFLLGKKISKSRIQTISYGEERPLKSSDTEKAYKLNRRAEITVK